MCKCTARIPTREVSVYISEKRVLQIEFFHEGPVAGTLEEFSERIRRRRQQGARIKTTVRIVTQDASLVHWMLLIYVLDAAIYALRQSMQACGAGRMSIALDGAFQRMRERRKARVEEHAISALEYAVNAGSGVAIEQTDRTFRPLMPEEAYELLETVAAVRANGTWLFLFHSGDLYADPQRLVCSIMM